MVVAFIFVSKLFMAPSPYFLRSAAADPARDFFLGFWLVSACYSGPGSSFFPPLSLVHVEQHFTIIISSHRSTLKLLVGREKKNLLLLLLLFPLLPLYIVDLCIKKQIVVIYLVGADIAPPSTYIYISMGGILFIYSGVWPKGGVGWASETSPSGECWTMKRCWQVEEVSLFFYFFGSHTKPFSFVRAY